MNETIVDLQRRLKALGYEPGTPDGIFARKTQNAVKVGYERVILGI